MKQNLVLGLCALTLSLSGCLSLESKKTFSIQNILDKRDLAKNVCNQETKENEEPIEYIESLGSYGVILPTGLPSYQMLAIVDALKKKTPAQTYLHISLLTNMDIAQGNEMIEETLLDKSHQLKITLENLLQRKNMTISCANLSYTKLQKKELSELMYYTFDKEPNVAFLFGHGYTTYQGFTTLSGDETTKTSFYISNIDYLNHPEIVDATCGGTIKGGHYSIKSLLFQKYNEDGLVRNILDYKNSYPDGLIEESDLKRKDIQNNIEILKALEGIQKNGNF